MNHTTGPRNLALPALLLHASAARVESKNLEIRLVEIWGRVCGKMIVEEQYESSRYSANLITSPPVLHAAFKTVSNAIDLAMIASSTALMQAASVELLQRSTNACVAVNCIRCGQLTMVAGSVTLVQGCERLFSGQGPGLSSKCSAEVLDGQLLSAVLRSSLV